VPRYRRRLCGVVSGKRFCVEAALTECGVDQVTTQVVETCAGSAWRRAIPQNAPPPAAAIISANCRAMRRGNDDDTDDCTSACKVAHCGDTVVWKDHEDCDDGSSLTEQCAYGMKSCSVCNACQLESGEAQFCGDGKRQDEQEQCDYGLSGEANQCNLKCELTTWALWELPYLSPGISNYAYTADTVEDHKTGIIWQRAIGSTALSWKTPRPIART